MKQHRKADEEAVDKTKEDAQNKEEKEGKDEEALKNKAPKRKNLDDKQEIRKAKKTKQGCEPSKPTKSPMKLAFGASKRVIESQKRGDEEDEGDSVRRKLFGDASPDSPRKKQRRLPKVGEPQLEFLPNNIIHIP